MASMFEKRRRPSGGRLSGGLAGFAAGAGFMYLLDPRRGAARRSQVVQRAGRVLREVEGTVEAGARDLRHRARGLAHEAAARVEREHAPDEVLVERVRAKLGRLAAHPGAIRVVCHEGKVELSGPIFSAEHGQAIRGVRLVRGVVGVEDRLEPHESAEGVPALQGAGPRPGPLPDPFQRHWAPRTRLLAGAAGTFLVGRALFGSGFARIPGGIAGAALLGKAFGDSQAVPREARRAARAASEVVTRERERRGEREEHAGAWHGGAEPAEGRPAPRGGGDRGGWSAESEVGGAEVVTGPGAEYVAPAAGAQVREGDLGAVVPRETIGEEEEPPRSAERDGEQGGAHRREPT